MHLLFSTTRPEPEPLLAGLALQVPKFFQIAEREARVGVAVALPDDFRVQECPVFEVDVSQGAAVLVFVSGSRVGLIQFQPNLFPRSYPTRELFRLSAEALDRLLRVLCLRRVDANETHPFIGTEDQSVPVDDPNDIPGTIIDGGLGGCGDVKKGGIKNEKECKDLCLWEHDPASTQIECQAILWRFTLGK